MSSPLRRSRRDTTTAENCAEATRQCLATFGEPGLAELRDRLRLEPADQTFLTWADRFQAHARHSADRYTITLLGEFNAGKSTLLNALLELPEAKWLPTADEPTTALPVRLTAPAAGEPEAEWVYEDDRRETVPWDKALDEARQSTRSGRAVREVVLRLDHPLLAMADFLDLPGTGTAWYEEHTSVARRYVELSEMVFWVIGSEDPGESALMDFERARARGVPLLTVFNAWGAFDPDEDARVRLPDQDDLELGVKTDFPSAGKLEPLRVYARRAAERHASGSAPEDSDGLVGLRRFLDEQVLLNLEYLARERRRSARLQLQATCREVSQQVDKDAESWQEQQERSSGRKSEAERLLRRLRRTSKAARAELRELASARADRVLQVVERQSDLFVERTLQISNFDLLKKTLTESGREALEAELVSELENDYLDLDKEQNWFVTELDEFLEDSLAVVESHWRRLDQDAAAASDDSTTVAFADLPFNDLKQGAIEGVQEAIKNLALLGTVLGVMLLVPGGQIVDAVVIGAAAFFSILGRDPFKSARENTKTRIRNALDMKQLDLKRALVSLVWEQVQLPMEKAFKAREQGGAEEATAEHARLEMGVSSLEQFSGGLLDATSTGKEVACND